LVLQKKDYQEKEKDSKMLRDTILFEEILTKSIDICIYDCLGYAYRRICLKHFAWMSLLAFFLLLTAFSTKIDKKTKNKTIGIGVLWLCMGMYYIRRFQKHHIERIIYQTNDKKFTLVKKTFFGQEKTLTVHKNNLLHTYDEYFNVKKINFVNLENLETYSIGYIYAWKEKELFAYLVGQNIK